MENFTITIDNKRIYDFYNTNTNINIESMNLLLLDFIELLNSDMSKIFTNTKLGEIMDSVKDIKQQISLFSDNLSLKLHDNNKEFIDTFKLIIGVSSNDNNDKIIQLMNKNTESFIERINITLPKSQDDTNKRIQDNLFEFKKSINDDIRVFLHQVHSDNSLRDFISTIENKIQIMQQPIFSLVSSNNTTIQDKLNYMREEQNSIKTTNDRVFTELNDFLNKYKSSSQYKGQVSENIIEKVLSQLYASGEIINTTGLTAQGDFMLRRENKPNIIFENKNYEQHIPINEIKKFIRDVSENNCDGIIMSQISGIVSKNDYQIEINNGKVLIYLHYVNYSPDKIKTAVSIIDHLSEKLNSISNFEQNNGINIRQENLDRINEQYRSFILQKDILINTAKDIQKRLISQIEELQIPDLKILLDDKYASIQTTQLNCKFCNLSFQNKKALGSHLKVHKTKNGIVINAE